MPICAGRLHREPTFAVFFPNQAELALCVQQKITNSAEMQNIHNRVNGIQSLLVSRVEV